MSMKKAFLIIFAFTSLLMSRCKDDGDEILCTAAPVVSAGNDTTIVNTTNLKLSGISDIKTGTWTIEEGTGGS